MVAPFIDKLPFILYWHMWLAFCKILSYSTDMLCFWCTEIVAYPVQRAPALCGVWGRVSVASLTLACAIVAFCIFNKKYSNGTTIFLSLLPLIVQKTRKVPANKNRSWWKLQSRQAGKLVLTVNNPASKKKLLYISKVKKTSEWEVIASRLGPTVKWSTIVHLSVIQERRNLLV